MPDRTTPVTDFLLDRPEIEAGKLAAVVATAVAHDIKFTVSSREKDLIDEAMFAVDQVPVEFIQMNPISWILQRRIDLREPVTTSRSQG